MSKCPVCGEIETPNPGNFEICEVCEWQDDPLQREDPNDKDGPNGGLSLKEYKKQWEESLETA